MGLAIYSESGLLKLTQMSPEVIVRKQHQEKCARVIVNVGWLAILFLQYEA